MSSNVPVLPNASGISSKFQQSTASKKNKLQLFRRMHRLFVCSSPKETVTNFFKCLKDLGYSWQHWKLNSTTVIMINTADRGLIFKINVIPMNRQSIIRFSPICGRIVDFLKHMFIIKNEILAIMFRNKFIRTANTN